MNLAITLKQAVPVPVKRQIKDLMGIKDPQVEPKKITVSYTHLTLPTKRIV